MSDNVFAELRDLQAGANGRKAVLRATRGDLTTIRRTRWAWKDWAPLGSLAIIAGEPGAGKGVWSSYLLANLTRGTAPGDLEGEPVNALWVGFEDSWEETVLPRVVAAGGAAERVYKLTVVNPGQFLDLVRDVAEVERVVKEHDIRVIAFEAIVDHLAIDDHKNQEVRRALTPMVEMTRRRAMLALGTTHLNKGSGTYRQRVAGSGGYLAVARVGWLVHQHPDEPDRVVLAHGKGNLGSTPTSLVFEIEGTEVVNPASGEVVPVGRVARKPYPDDSLTVDAVLAGPRGDHGSREDEVADFLRSVLSEGPVSSADVYEAGKQRGFGDKLLKRHKDAAGVVVFQTREGWRWKLK